MNVLEVIGRTAPLFSADVSQHEAELRAIVSKSRFLDIELLGRCDSPM